MKKVEKNKKKVKKNINSKSTFNNKFKQKKYFSFGFRVTINALLFICFVIPCFIVASKTIEREKTIPINYTDVNQINYRVYLKDNDVYKEKYLDMNRAYVANLIDYIDINYNYIFNIDTITSMNFDYKIIGQLIIENDNGSKYVDKEYVLKETKNKKLSNSGTISIDDNVVIDYDYYNSLANKFKSTTGIDTTSYLNIYLQVCKKTDNNLNYKIDETVKSNVKIPLSVRAIEINLTTNQSTTNKQIIPKGKMVFNQKYLFIEIILFIIACFFMLKLIKYLVSLIKVKTPYDKYINKILKSYDRLIVETKTEINMSDCKIIEVISFNELLDVRDNLKKPIIYYNIVKHQKGMFYIKNDNDVYRYMVKGIDLNK